MKKMAICISGQPRTWRKCVDSWKQLAQGDVEVDYFFHMWDYNTIPSLWQHELDYKGNFEDQIITDQEKNDILEYLNPKAYKFESRKSVQYWNCDIDPKFRFGSWCPEQNYSNYCVAALKREYEILNDVVYDIAIKIRADLHIRTISLTPPQPETIYTCGNQTSNMESKHLISDVFYYGDSMAFDQMSHFYKFLSFYATNNLLTPATLESNVPTLEFALYPYMFNIGLRNEAIKNFRYSLMRDLEVRDSYGINLRSYETV